MGVSGSPATAGCTDIFRARLQATPGFVLAHWCGSAECEARIKAERLRMEEEFQDERDTWRQEKNLDEVVEVSDIAGQAKLPEAEPNPGPAINRLRCPERKMPWQAN